MGATQNEILELLTSSGVISQADSERVKEIVSQGERIDQALLRLGLVSEEERGELVEFVYGVPYVDLSKYLCDLEAAKFIPEEVARRCKVIPMFVDGDEITLAVAELTSEEEIRSCLLPDVKKPLRIVVADKKQIEEMIPRYYQSAKVMEEAIEQVARESRELIPGSSIGAVEEALEEIDLSQELTREASVVALFHAVLINAVKAGATHVHFLPRKSALKVKIRMKGKLSKTMDLPKNVIEPIYRRIKRMAGLPEIDKPLYGSLKIPVRGRELHLKVSFLPSRMGERLVIWGFEEEVPSLVFKTLGLTKEESFSLWNLINRPFGFIFVGGNEAGAKLALNAILIALNRADTSLLFLSPPEVEINIPDIERIDYPLEGMSLFELIKFISTQDADVIAVWGANSTREVSQLMQFSLTGKLVFLALPNRSGLEFVEEAVQSHIDKNLVALSLTGSVANYLLKRLCPDCRKQVKHLNLAEVFKDTLVESGDWFSEGSTPKLLVYQAVGCPKCQKGHVGVFSVTEIITATPRLKRCVIEGQNAQETSVIIEAGREKTIASLLKEELLKGKIDFEQAFEIIGFWGKNENIDS